MRQCEEWHPSGTYTSVSAVTDYFSGLFSLPLALVTCSSLIHP